MSASLRLTGAALLLTACAAAAEPAPESCATPAAARHGVNATMLRALLRVEAAAPLPVVVPEENGRVDVGRTGRLRVADLERGGIVPPGTGTACLVAHLAAWRLAAMLQQYGNSWFAVGAFASTATYYNNRYQALIHNELVRMGALQGTLRRVPSLRPSESPDAPGADELVVYQVIIQDR